MRKNIILLIFLSVLLGCSSKIKSITEFSNQDGILSKNRIVAFDKEGNKLLEQNFGNERSNRITKSEYKNGLKVLEIDCDYFQKEDTCVLRQFSKYEYDINNRLIAETKFEEDSAVRFIRENHYFKDLEVEKTMTWGMISSKQPDYGEARVYIDTIYYDKLRRKIKIISSSPDFKKPFIEIYKYTKKGYSRELKGTYNNDTILSYKYNKLQKKAIKNKINFDFGDMERNKYEFEYY
ncbi:hypothetical protein [Flavobacterium sandaracinum]|uniref:Lipoprotein n=1 Tax=Flavobacterium sandaracinum TaxID=2541733 RepID=A0A4R5D455_9FLAO|nr:hypothetical protein [Flavobacterium sandaracinum]TDE06014.1 hypothetical protein E0F91_05395 [Flavobacterium sandaracinum]